jgi:hypothetical protein
MLFRIILPEDKTGSQQDHLKRLGHLETPMKGMYAPYKKLALSSFG